MNYLQGWIIIRAVTKYLERVDEEKQLWLETNAALESRSKGKVVSSDEVHAWMRTWYTAKEKPAPEMSRLK